MTVIFSNSNYIVKLFLNVKVLLPAFLFFLIDFQLPNSSKQFFWDLNLNFSESTTPTTN